MPVQPHIIRKQILNVRTTGGNADGVRLQQETEQLYRAQVLPGLEKLLDKYGAGDEVISIDKLEISLKDIKPDRISSALVQQILNEVERQLRQILQKAGSGDQTKYTAEERFLQCWVHYLHQGYFPWWATIRDAGSWQEQLESFISRAPLSLLQRLKAHFTSKQVLSRLSMQMNDPLFWLFFKRLSGWHDTLLSSLQADEKIMGEILSGFTPQSRFRQKFRELLLSVCNQAYTQHLLTDFFAGKLVAYLHTSQPEGLYELKTAPLQTEELKDAIIDHAGSVEDMIDPLESLPETEETPRLKDEDIYVNNAGIVLIAAYLPAFFRRLELVEDNKIKDLQRAVGVLQYVVSGDDDYAEFEMVLPKILCGVNPEFPVADGYRPTDEEREMADGMLTAVISHWDVLKNTTTAGLRGTFLQREGKLKLNNDAWQLRVQEQPFDMLLDQLPWSISMIRLPWMQHLLQVSWR